MMETVHALLDEAAHALPGDDAQREAVLLLRHVLGVSEAWLIAHADDTVDGPHAAAFQKLVERRAHGEPIAYLTGIRGFHALELRVTPDVLIPRPETELLVDLALARIPLNAKGSTSDAACSPDAAQRNPGVVSQFAPDSVSLHPGYRIADLGTGSGAIALAIAWNRPDARVLATDASGVALGIAHDNAERLGLRNVGFAQGNWCAALGNARFDVIVSNPPYVAEADPHLGEGDLRFEPPLALSSGVDGLDAIRAIVSDACKHLRESGWLLFEHGFGQGVEVRGLLGRHGYTEIFTERDLEGRERVSGGRWA